MSQSQSFGATSTGKPVKTVVDADSSSPQDVKIEVKDADWKPVPTQDSQETWKPTTTGTSNGTAKDKKLNSATSKVIIYEDPMHKEPKNAQLPAENPSVILQSQSPDKVAAMQEAAARNRRNQTKAKEEKSSVLRSMAIKAYAKRSRKQCMSWKGVIWTVLIVLQLIGAIISVVLLLPKKPPGGWLDFGPRPTMLVKDLPNAVFLAISRITAYMMYPAVLLVFTSKAHCLRTWVWSTPLRLYLPFFERLHDVHVRGGWVCFGLTWLHCIFHIIRWIRLDCMNLLWENQTGITGFIGWICCTLVCLPMGLKCCRKRIHWEYRKCIHTILGVGFGLCGALHAPKTKVIYAYGTVVVIYALDWFYAQLFKSYEVETCHFTRLHQSVVLHWENPQGYNHTQHGYVNICIPFIRRYEWHAISIYPHATKPNCSSLCIARAGDWSNKLHDDTLWKTTRPVWIQGPFLTPFSATVEFDNCICVSSGSGVSASLAALQSLKKNRRVNFIWLCRDHSMVEFYLKTYDFDEDAYTLIFYTGKSQLSVPTQLKPNVLVFQSRPDLRSIVCMIIASIEHGDALPETLIKQSEAEEKRMQEYHEQLASIHDETDPLRIFELLLARSLKYYSHTELLKKLEGKEEDLSLSEMQQVLLKITPEARFAESGLQELCTFFNDGDSEMKTINRQRLIDHCRQILEDQHHGGGGLKKKEEAEDPQTSEDLKRKFIKGGGSQDLKKFCAEDDEEKVTGRLSRWAVLYCGGSLPVSTALTQVCRDFDITYEQEKFDW